VSPRAEPYLFVVGGDVFALAREDVAGLADPAEILALPRSPALLLGAVYWRGEFLPVVEVTELLTGRARGEARMLLVVHRGARRAALAVEEVPGSGAEVELPVRHAWATSPVGGRLDVTLEDRTVKAIWVETGRLLDAVTRELERLGEGADAVQPG